jgi:hypothetical protein
MIPDRLKKQISDSESNSMKRTTAVIGLSALAFILALGFVPAVAASSGPSHSLTTAQGCTVTWNNPSGTYSPGSAVVATVTTTCMGSGAWSLTSQPSGSLVAGGTWSCGTGGCTVTTFSGTAGTAPITPGTYQYTGLWNGAQFSFSFTVSQFLVTPEFPAGILLGVLAPIAAVFGYLKFRKPSL